MADSRKRLVFRTIKQHGGRLVRWKNHKVFRFPDGWNFVTPKTPGDWRAWQKSHSELRRLLRMHESGPSGTIAQIGKGNDRP